MSEPQWLTFDQFSGRVGETFDVTAKDGPTIRTELVSATESSHPGGTGPDGQERLQFSLVFRGPQDLVLGQGLHQVDHPEIGPLDLFLVPLGPGEAGMQYEAVFA